MSKLIIIISTTLVLSACGTVKQQPHTFKEGELVSIKQAFAPTSYEMARKSK